MAGKANLANVPQAPLALGQGTAGTFAQQTAWRTPRAGASVPLSYSKKTKGTTFSWDDDTTAPKFEQK